MVGIKEICALLLAGGIGAGSVVTVQKAVPAAKKVSSSKAAKPSVHRSAARPTAARPSALDDCPPQLGLLGQNISLPPLSPIDVAPGLSISETAMGIPSGGAGGGIPGVGGTGFSPAPPGPGDGSSTPAVPEIGTWAMLVSGFGLIGLALRRSDRSMPRA